MPVQWLREERGSQIVEFALIAPILIYLVLMVPILGMSVRAWVIAEGAAREGARVLAVTGDMTATCNRVFEEMTLFGQLPTQFEGSTVFTRRDIMVNRSTGEVSVLYRQPTVLPALGLLVSGDPLDDYFQVVGKARFRLEHEPTGSGGPATC